MFLAAPKTEERTERECLHVEFRHSRHRCLVELILIRPPNLAWLQLRQLGAIRDEIGHA